MAAPLADKPDALRWPRLLLCVGLPLLFALTLGLDSNWDLLNYHLYNPHALLHGRAADVAPAQLQSFHSPVLDLPYYLLSVSGLHPRVAMSWLVLPTMLALWLLLRLRAAMAPPPEHARREVAIESALALLVLGGAATWSTMATTMNDAFVAAGMLGALAIVTLTPAGKHRWLCAGLLAGATAGLKLSAAFYCIALALAALPGGDWRHRARRVFALGVGGALGFAVTYGWWGWHLYAEHGNPFFPYYNDLFHSPDARIASYADERFRQHGLDLLLAPWHLLHKSLRFSELKLRDPRLLLGLLALGWLWLRARAGAELPALQRERLQRLGLFFLSATAMWMLQYGVYRYAIVLEQLGCLLLVLAIAPQRGGWRLVALWLAVLVVVSVTMRPNWGRDALPLTHLGMQAPALGKDALVVTDGWEPVGAFVVGLPDEVPVLGLDNTLVSPTECTRLRARAEATLARHEGPIWLLASSNGDAMAKAQAQLGERFGLGAAGACTPWKFSFGTALLCPQRRTGPAPPPACR